MPLYDEAKKSTSKKTAHWHACKRCPTAYEDNCAHRDVDDICIVCRGGRGWTLLIENRNPRPCCRETARLVTKDEKKNYRLAGTSLWFICRRCARTQPFDPKSHLTKET